MKLKIKIKVKTWEKMTHTYYNVMSETEIKSDIKPMETGYK